MQKDKSEDPPKDTVGQDLRDSVDLGQFNPANWPGGDDPLRSPSTGPSMLITDIDRRSRAVAALESMSGGLQAEQQDIIAQVVAFIMSQESMPSSPELESQLANAQRVAAKGVEEAGAARVGQETLAKELIHLQTRAEAAEARANSGEVTLASMQARLSQCEPERLEAESRAREAEWRAVEKEKKCLLEEQRFKELEKEMVELRTSDEELLSDCAEDIKRLKGQIESLKKAGGDKVEVALLKAEIEGLREELQGGVEGGNVRAENARLKVEMAQMKETNEMLRSKEEAEMNQCMKELAEEVVRRQNAEVSLSAYVESAGVEMTSEKGRLEGETTKRNSKPTHRLSPVNPNP